VTSEVKKAELYIHTDGLNVISIFIVLKYSESAMLSEVAGSIRAAMVTVTSSWFWVPTLKTC
jgi:hypothetical protein